MSKKSGNERGAEVKLKAGKHGKEAVKSTAEEGVKASVLRHKTSLAAACVLAAASIAFVAHDISKRAEEASTPERPSATSSDSGDAVSGGGPDPELFVPVERDTKISRADIPANLQGLIGKFGKVVHFPKEYDPTKPNLYLLGASHVETFSGQYNEGGYKVQDEILRIFHLLYSLGVERQFLEGVTGGEAFGHNVDNPKYNETPISAMPKYKKSGKIKRAYVAAEGVYGDEVESVGVDVDMEDAQRISAEYQKFDSEEFPMVAMQILEGVGRDLGIEFDYASLYKDPSASERLHPVIKQKLASMSKEDLGKLAEKHVLNNPGYKRWLQVATEFLYMKLEGRNDAFVRGIHDAGRSGKKDAVFIVGGDHVPGVLERLESSGDYNLFFIVPNSGRERSDEYYRKTKAEYREAIIAADLYHFGLGHEPENPVGF
jgi:hypothetical protein